MRLLIFRILNKLFNVERKFMDLALSNSMLHEQHFVFLNQFIKKMNLDKIKGSIVECGVWKGGVSMWMMFCQKKYSVENHFYLYDTFDGMTTPSAEKDGKDVVSTYKKIANNNYQRNFDKWHDENKWAYCPIDVVKENIAKAKYKNSKIHYIVGDVNITLNDEKNLPKNIAILRLDTDFYESTKKELEVLYPRVVKGGIVIVDDYYSFKGSGSAVDEYIKENKLEFKIKILDNSETGGRFSFTKI